VCVCFVRDIRFSDKSSDIFLDNYFERVFLSRISDIDSDIFNNLQIASLFISSSKMQEDRVEGDETLNAQAGGPRGKIH
jgi:hypothetical protein